MKGMAKTFCLIVAAAVLAATPNCTTVDEGSRGIRRSFGIQDNELLTPGWHFYNPIWSDIYELSLGTKNVEVKLSLPSKEGLNIEADISILYSISAEKIPALLVEFGADDFEQNEKRVVGNVFRSAAADVSARFLAKDMHSGMRSRIEKEIRDRMRTVLADKGFLIDKVLMKSISLPPDLYKSIEMKLQAEQDAQRMVFVLEQERREAERRKIEASGVRDAQKILSQGLSKEIIQLRSIEAFKELAKSPNTKVIITDGKTPMMISNPR
jgi:prohibitin 1